MTFMTSCNLKSKETLTKCLHFGLCFNESDYIDYIISSGPKCINTCCKTVRMWIFNMNKQECLSGVLEVRLDFKSSFVSLMSVS